MTLSVQLWPEELFLTVEQPNNLVKPNVRVMAIQPPISTLRQDFPTGVLPSIAPSPPNANNARLATTTTTANLILRSLINAAASSGIAAPTENAKADARAARNGFGSFIF